jgi:hypothetical protein
MKSWIKYFLDQIKILREKQQQQRKQVTLFRSPIQTIGIFSIVMFNNFCYGVEYLRRHSKATLSVLFVSTLLFCLYFIPGSHQQPMITVKEVVWTGLWWVVLGVLSSVGLGTGLHTFVLYLGPLIAKATIAATECNSTDFALYGPERFICPPENSIPTDAAVAIGFWAILYKVQFEALMWGIGTAIGELPPYFVARAARLSGESLRELEAAEEEEEGEGLLASAMRRIKPLMYSILGNLGFFGILLFASVPNPLFDLAGITCGHFLVPFTSFFGATLIGKAFIKAHIQTIFVIIVFSKERLDQLVTLVESAIPWLQGHLHAIIESEKAKLHRTEGGDVILREKSILGRLWDLVLIGMLCYFLLSIVESSVQHYLVTRDEAKVLQLKKKKNSQKAT